MSTDYRKKVLEALADAMERNPEQRVGQLIFNALDLAERRLGREMRQFHVSDQELAAALICYPPEPSWLTP